MSPEHPMIDFVSAVVDFDQRLYDWAGLLERTGLTPELLNKLNVKLESYILWGNLSLYLGGSWILAVRFRYGEKELVVETPQQKGGNRMSEPLSPDKAIEEVFEILRVLFRDQ